MPPAGLVDLCAERGWPLLAEPVSGVPASPHRPAATARSRAGALLAADAGFREHHHADLVMQFGAAATSRGVQELVRRADRLAHRRPRPDRRRSGPPVDAHPGRATRRRSSRRSRAARSSLPRHELRVGRRLAGRRPSRVRKAVDALLDSWDEPFEGRVARDLAAAMPGRRRALRGLEHADPRHRPVHGAARRDPGARQPRCERHRRASCRRSSASPRSADRPTPCSATSRCCTTRPGCSGARGAVARAVLVVDRQRRRRHLLAAPPVVAARAIEFETALRHPARARPRGDRARGGRRRPLGRPRRGARPGDPRGARRPAGSRWCGCASTVRARRRFAPRSARTVAAALAG